MPADHHNSSERTQPHSIPPTLGSSRKVEGSRMVGGYPPGGQAAMAPYPGAGYHRPPHSHHHPHAHDYRGPPPPPHGHHMGARRGQFQDMARREYSFPPPHPGPPHVGRYRSPSDDRRPYPPPSVIRNLGPPPPHGHHVHPPRSEYPPEGGQQGPRPPPARRAPPPYFTYPMPDSYSEYSRRGSSPDHGPVASGSSNGPDHQSLHREPPQQQQLPQPQQSQSADHVSTPDRTYPPRLGSRERAMSQTDDSPYPPQRQHPHQGGPRYPGPIIAGVPSPGMSKTSSNDNVSDDDNSSHQSIGKNDNTNTSNFDVENINRNINMQNKPDRNNPVHHMNIHNVRSNEENISNEPLSPSNSNILSSSIYTKDDSFNAGCTCKKSKCLKLYCQCFAAKMMCEDRCRCLDCKNNPGSMKERNAAIQTIMLRNPTAFETKFKGRIRSGGAPGTKVGLSLEHKVGCKCRRSACLKKYCECFHAQVKCSDACRCIGCKNRPTEGSGGGRSNMPGPYSNIQAGIMEESPMRKKGYGGARGFKNVMDAAQNLAFLKNMTPTDRVLAPRAPGTRSGLGLAGPRSLAYSLRTDARGSMGKSDNKSQEIHRVPSLTVADSISKEDDSSSEGHRSDKGQVSAQTPVAVTTNPQSPEDNESSVNALLLAAYAMAELSGTPSRAQNDASVDKRKKSSDYYKDNGMDTKRTRIEYKNTASPMCVTNISTTENLHTPILQYDTEASKKEHPCPPKNDHERLHGVVHAPQSALIGKDPSANNGICEKLTGQLDSEADINRTLVK